MPPQSHCFGDRRQLRCFQPEKYNLRALASGWEQRAGLPWQCLASLNSSTSLSSVTSTRRHRTRCQQPPPLASSPGPDTRPQALSCNTTANHAGFRSAPGTTERDRERQGGHSLGDSTPPPRRRSLREGGTRRGRLLSRARTARPRLRSFINSPGLLSSRFIVPGRTGKGREDRRGLRCARCPLSLEERGYPEAPAHRLLPCPCAPAPLTSQGRAGVGWSWEAGRHEDVHRLLLAAARIRNSLCVRERGLGK